LRRERKEVTKDLTSSFTSKATRLILRGPQLILAAEQAAQREVLSLRGPRFEDLSPLAVATTQAGDCRWENEFWRLHLRGDGVLRLAARQKIEIETSFLRPAEFRREHGDAHVQLAPEGGAGTWGHGGARRRSSDGKDRWLLPRGAELWSMALPARPWRRRSERIAHEGQPSPFPSSAYLSDEDIAEIGATAEIFAWHAYFWRALPRGERPLLSRYAWRRCSWMSRRHEPELPEEMARVLAAVRRAGMQPVAYLSPLHARSPDIAEEMRRILEIYDFEGLYLDGTSPDFVEADHILRTARQILGPKRLLYLNLGEGPFRDAALPAPFLEAQADFVLRGSNGRGGLALADYFHAVLSGRMSGGAQGVWCPYGSRGLIPRDDPPSSEEIELAAGAGVQIWRRSHWKRSPRALRAFDEARARFFPQNPEENGNKE
jgi:hypothetical protein